MTTVIGERKQAAEDKCNNFLGERYTGSYGWMREGLADEQIAVMTDDDIKEAVLFHAQNAYDYAPDGDEIRDVLTFDEFLAASDYASAVKWFTNTRDDLRDEQLLNDVMTAKEIAEEFGIKEDTVRDAIEHGWLIARKSFGTWLVLRKHAEARWRK